MPFRLCYIRENTVDPDVIRSIYKYWLDPNAPAEKKQMAQAFWDEYFQGSKMIHPIMLELEKTAFNAGYTFDIRLPLPCRMVRADSVRNAIRKRESVFIRRLQEFPSMLWVSI